MVRRGYTLGVSWSQLWFLNNTYMITIWGIGVYRVKSNILLYPYSKLTGLPLCTCRFSNTYYGRLWRIPAVTIYPIRINPTYQFILTNLYDSCVKLTDPRLLIEQKLLTIPCPEDRNRETIQKWFPYTPASTFAPFLCVGWWTTTMFYALGTQF